MEVILKVTEFRVNTNYGKSGMTVATIGDVLYAVTVPDSYQVETGTGDKVFTIEGIRHIIKGLHVALIIDVDRQDF